MVGNLVDDYRLTRDLTLRTIRLAQKEEDFVLEDTMIGYKNYLDKTIWLLQAFLSQSALEGEDE